MANIAPPGSPGALTGVKSAGVKLSAKEKYSLVDREAEVMIEALKVIKRLHQQIVATNKKNLKDGTDGWGFVFKGGKEVFLDDDTFKKSVNGIVRSIAHLKATVRSNQKRVSGRAGQGKVRTEYLTAGKRLTQDAYNFFANDPSLTALKAATGTVTEKVNATTLAKSKTYKYTGNTENPFLPSLSTFSAGQNTGAISTHDLKRLLRLACVESENYTPIRKQKYNKDGTPDVYKKTGLPKYAKQILYRLPAGLRGGSFNDVLKALVSKKANAIKAAPNAQGQLVSKRYVVVFNNPADTQAYLTAVNAEIDAGANAARASVDNAGAAPINKNFTLSDNLYAYIPVERRTAESQTAEKVYIDVNFLEKKDFGSIIGAFMQKEQTVNSKGQQVLKFVDVQLADNQDTAQLEFNLKRKEGEILKLADGDLRWRNVN